MNQQRFTWDEKKRQANLKKHGLDFAYAQDVFDTSTLTYEDKRYFYNERRFILVGYLNGVPVSITYTEDDYEIRIISFRKASRRDTEFFHFNT